MNFVLRMAWRDSRAARRRLVLYSFSIVLGVAALVAIGSFSANLNSAIEGQAKGLLGADLAVHSRVALTPEAKAFLDSLGGEQAREVAFSTMVVFPDSGGRTRLVSLRAMEGAYPFYGEFLTDPAGAPSRLVAGEAVAVLEETLMSQYGVKIGDPIRLGTSTFTVAGALRNIPGESAAVAMLSPRILIPYSRLAETGLLGPGSLVRYKTYFKFAAATDVERLVEDLRARFRELRLGFDTVEERKNELGQSIRNVDAFFSLVGFVALFLGAIGVASAIHVYVRQRIATVAVLRCLGAGAWKSFSVYLVQGLLLGLVGAVVGAVLGVAIQVSLPALVKDLLPFDVDFFISWSAVLRGVGAGLVICFLFTLLPLLSIRRVSPLMAIRASAAEESGSRDPLRWTVFAAIAIAVIVFAVWQAPRWQVGLGFVGALAVSFGVLAGLARGVSWCARRLVPPNAPYVWRQGIANLYRPNNRTVLLLLALGLGTFLVVTLALTRATLLAQIQGVGDNQRPNLLFFDIQDDQIGPLQNILHEEGAELRAKAPIVTMRLRSLKGRTVEQILKDEGSRIPAWTLRREYRSTYRGTLSATEKVIAGEFVGKVSPEAAVIPISIERGLAKDMQLGLGDTLEFDVHGVPMAARITSIREVEWRRMEPNFFMLFPEGALEAAPKFYVVATRVETPADSARLQQAVVSALPNVSAIDLALILQTLDGIFSKVQVVVQFMALFTVVTGVIVLAGAILSGRHQRLRESVLLRTLGASRRQLIRIQVVEYAILGALAAVVGCALAVGANALLAHFVFETTGALAPLTLVGAVAAVIVVTLATGLLSSRGVVDHPPLEVLRQET
ncbi:MAG: FtsX-like permease family protein [Opitutaceae bacterium]|nr:FtsX-like permease family protein [Opitutaceae bacterium]